MKASEIVYGLGYFDWEEIGRAEGYARRDWESVYQGSDILEGEPFCFKSPRVQHFVGGQLLLNAVQGDSAKCPIVVFKRSLVTASGNKIGILNANNEDINFLKSQISRLQALAPFSREVVNLLDKLPYKIG